MLPYFVLHFLLLLLLVLFLLSTKAKVWGIQSWFLICISWCQSNCLSVFVRVRLSVDLLFVAAAYCGVCVSVAVPPLYFSITTNCKIKLNHGSAAPNPKHGLNIHKQKVQKKTPMHKIKGAKNHSQVCWPWRGANKHYWCVYTIWNKSRTVDKINKLCHHRHQNHRRRRH